MNTAIKLYLLDCESRNLSPRTMESNTFILHEFHRYTDVNLGSVTPTHIRQYLAHKSETTSKSTARRYYTTLSPFFRWCLEEGLIETNPVARISPPKAPKPIIEPLTQEEMTKLIQAADGKSFLSVRNRFIVILFIDTGLRASELIDLNLDDVNLPSGVLTVRHGKGDKPRIVPFGTTTEQVLKQYLVKRGEQDCPALIINCYGDRPKRDLLVKLLWRLSKKAGIRQVHPHMLRHSMAVAYLRSGGDVFSLQKILGHSTLSMTRHYAELANTDVIDKHRLHSPADSLQIAPEKRKRIR